jgi:hypothetical protein
VVPINPNDQPFTNYQCYWIAGEDILITTNGPEHEQEEVARAISEMGEMPPGNDIHRWLLEHYYQLQACAFCGKRESEDIKLLTCSSCQSFKNCCPKHQRQHWREEHKEVCLRRDNW